MQSSCLSLAPVTVLVIQVIAASLVLFLAAHLLLFKLYLPARFVAWTVPLALSIAAGVGVTALLTCAAERLTATRSGWLVGAAALLLAGGLALYPAAFDGNFVTDRTPAITAYLRSLPPDTLVVGAPVEADSVPAFSGRRVLTNREYALAYHTGFYQQVQDRTRAAIEAYYAESPQQLVEFAGEVWCWRVPRESCCVRSCYGDGCLGRELRAVHLDGDGSGGARPAVRVAGSGAAVWRPDRGRRDGRFGEVYRGISIAGNCSPPFESDRCVRPAPFTSCSHANSEAEWPVTGISARPA